MVDYSKWDRLELSDDSDIECHPNVDKASFIRWKQRDIHEKRAQRKAEIKGLKIQKEMYTKLTERVNKLLKHFSIIDITDAQKRNEYINNQFDPQEKCTIEQDDNSPTYNEMIEDLFTQIEADIKKEGKDVQDGSTILQKVKEHQGKINKVLEQIDPKLEELEEEKHEHITSEDYHVGFDSSFINKNEKQERQKENDPDAINNTNDGKHDPAASEGASASESKQYKEKVETINDVRDDSGQKPSKPLNQLDDVECLPETLVFSKIPQRDIEDAGMFVKEHLYIACEQQKDSLMMKAFDSELSGDKERTKQIVHQGLLLQYLDDLFRGAVANHSALRKKQLVDMFVEKMSDANSPAYAVFMQDYDKMYKHIISRCKILKEEQEKEDPNQGVEQIQLRSVDSGSELTVQLPKEGTEEYKYFQTLPESMQKALKTEDLDEINKVFASMSVEDAEQILDTFDRCGVIQVQALLDNEEQFDELKKQCEKTDKTSSKNVKDGIESLSINEQQHQPETRQPEADADIMNTADIVD